MPAARSCSACRRRCGLPPSAACGRCWRRGRGGAEARRCVEPRTMSDVSAPVIHALSVLYQDASLAVVDKPAGLMVHDSELARGETDFAADRLRAQFGRPIFLVHRLDRATSGCLLLAF